MTLRPFARIHFDEHQRSLIEQQALIVELLEHFVFELPPDKPEIQRMPSGIVMIPMIRNKLELGSQMPLLVSMVK